MHIHWENTSGWKRIISPTSLKQSSNTALILQEEIFLFDVLSKEFAAWLRLAV
jgi:hypothetical protein